MFLPKCTLLVGLILTLLLSPIIAKRGGGSHSYPRSGGLSGGGHRSGGLSGGGHGYPSGGHSGGSHGYPSSGGGHSGGSHGYPSSGGGLSGGGSHGYPSSGGGLSGGSHGYPSSGGNHGYPPVKPAGSGSSGGSHTYPSSGNNHGYPSSGGGLSGGGHGYPANKPATHTTVHNHYHYSPPTQISYASPRGAPISYPVYHGTPPTYVYQYKDSGSKYGTLLAGLALMNLGTLGVAAYAAHQANNNHGSGGGHVQYRSQPGEVCKFAIKRENGDYEETRIDCQIISSFIYQDMQERQKANNSTVTTTTTVTNVTIVNNTVGAEQPAPAQAPNILYTMLPNGTLVPVNVTGVNIPGMPGITPNVTQNAPAATSSVVTTTTTTNTTLVSALDVKGKPVDVTPGMQCFVIRNSPVSNMRKNVPCGLLQTYADKSLRVNSAATHVPMFTIVAAIVAYCVAY